MKSYVQMFDNEAWWKICECEHEGDACRIAQAMANLDGVRVRVGHKKDLKKPEELRGYIYFYPVYLLS